MVGTWLIWFGPMIQPGLTGVGSRELAEQAGLSKERDKATAYSCWCCWAILWWLWLRAVVVLGGEFCFPPVISLRPFVWASVDFFLACGGVIQGWGAQTRRN